MRETTICAGDKVSTLLHALLSRINIITLPCVAVVFLHIPIHINKHPIYTYTIMGNYHLFLYHYIMRETSVCAGDNISTLTHAVPSRINITVWRI